RHRADREALSLGLCERRPGRPGRDEALLACRPGVDDRLVLEPAEPELPRCVAVTDCLHPGASSWFDPAQGTLARMATHTLSLGDVNLLDHDMFAEREPWDV